MSSTTATDRDLLVDLPPDVVPDPGDPARGQRHRGNTRKPPPPERTPRRYLLLAAGALLVVALLQRPGKIVADTKAALAIDPAKWLAQSLHLWNATADSGSIANQSAGYLTPMGPFFLLTHALGVPTAVAQRLWLALLLIVGLWGLVRLADALCIGNRPGRVLGGLAYSVSPFVVSRVGDTSGLVLGGALLPWVLLPLVRATFINDELGPRTFSARRVAAQSGCAVLLIGGINASVALDVLIAPVLWLVFMCRGRGAWALRAWWVGAVIAATGWWVIALVIQGRYGIDFVRYTETAATTTSVTSLPETLRGTADWFGYLRLGGSGSPSAFTYIGTPAAVVASFVLVALGLVGLSRRYVPARRFLVGCLVIGVVAVAAAYGGDAHGVLADAWRKQLSGSLSALRNVNKFEPLIRLPLALGLASCLPLLRPDSALRRRFWRGWLSAVSLLVVTAAVVVGAAPLGLGRIYQGSTFAVPPYWSDAVGWLNNSAKASRTLLLPGTGFANYQWGNSRDDPMLWLSNTDWAVRNLIPAGGINSTRWLDGIEEQLEQRAAPGLGDTLARGGVGFVLVRNDLNDVSSDLPPSTDQVHAALKGSGLRRVASFGPLVAGRRSGLQQFFGAKAAPGRYPALEVYAVPGAQRADTYPTSELAVLSGGPEALAALSSTGVLGDRPTVMAADVAAGREGEAQLPAGIQPTEWIATDSLARRDESFGSVHDAASYLLTSNGTAGSVGEPKTRLDVNPQGHQSVAQYAGIDSVSASASGFLLRQSSQLGPQAAVDGNPSTSWAVSGFPNRNVGQWIQLSLPTSRSLPYVTVRLLAESSKRTRVTALRVTAGSGSRVTQLGNTEAPQRVALPAGPATTVRLTIESVAGSGKGLMGSGIREIGLPGVSISRDVALPDDAKGLLPAGGGQTLTYVFSRERGDPLAFVDTGDERTLNRAFTVPRTATFFATGTAVAQNGVIPPEARGGSIVDLACGSGPVVSIDGKRFQTYLHGSRAALRAGQPVSIGLCDLRPVTLAAGSHTLRSDPGAGTISATTFTLTTQTAPPTAPTRETKTSVWGSEHRQVQVAAGSSSILTVHENFNKSWTATVDGKRLAPLRVDGWQQGFVLPAASGPVTVKLVNHPGIWERRGFVGAAVLVLLLLLAAVLPSRRKSHRVDVPRRHSLLVVRVALLLGAVGTTLLVAGPFVSIAVPLVALIAWWLRRTTPVLVLTGVTVAMAMTLSSARHYPSSHAGAFSAVAQVAVALALVALILVGGIRRAEVQAGGERGRHDGDSDGRPAKPGAVSAGVREGDSSL